MSHSKAASWVKNSVSPLQLESEGVADRSEFVRRRLGDQQLWRSESALRLFGACLSLGLRGCLEMPSGVRLRLSDWRPHCAGGSPALRVRNAAQDDRMSRYFSFLAQVNQIPVFKEADFRFIMQATKRGRGKESACICKDALRQHDQLGESGAWNASSATFGTAIDGRKAYSGPSFLKSHAPNSVHLSAIHLPSTKYNCCSMAL